MNFSEILTITLTIIVTCFAVTILLMYFKIQELKSEIEICVKNYNSLLKRTQSENDTYLDSKHTKRRL